MQTLISVIIPVFDGEAYLHEALESVLAQTIAEFELIIIDDGSGDSSAAIAQQFATADARVRCLGQKNQGVTVARNRGIEASRGELIAFLDQDDRWTPDALERHVREHRENTGAGYSIARQRCFLEPGTTPPAWFRLQRLESPAVAYLPGTLAVKRDTFSKLGTFDPRYPISSDADWFARARDQRVPELQIDAVVLERRIHRDNQSQQAEQIHGELFDLLRASIRRKRGTGVQAAGAYPDGTRAGKDDAS
jgi:glycosyltransferase involved in cell wall biosynthesis